MNSKLKKAVIPIICTLSVIGVTALFLALSAGKSISADASENGVLSGWTQNDGKWSYSENGKLFKNGLYKIAGSNYIFDKNGIMLTGIQNSKGKLYYFNESGNSPEEGLGTLKALKGWKVIKNKNYFFKNSAAVTGWEKISSKVYRFNLNGSLIIGLKKVGKNTYYFNPNGRPGTKGAAASGWEKISGKKYYFSPKGKLGKFGKMYKGFKKIGKYKYVFSSSGVLQKGIVKFKKTRYYADKKGRIDSRFRKAAKIKGKYWNIIDGKAYKVKTKSQKTLYRALKIASKITTKKMSKPVMLKKCFNYVKKAYREMNPRIPHYHGMDWPVVYANDMFIRGKGNCLSYAAAFAYMAKAIGYKKVYCCHSGGHGWAEINGLVYDPEWSIHYHDNDYYALKYGAKTTQNYKGAIAAGYKWMHVKI